MPQFTFSLTDMVLYHKSAYLATVEAYQTNFWPALLAAVPLTLYMIYALWAGSSPKLFPAILGGSWLWCGWVFFREYYATLNWGAPKIVWVFTLQGVLFLLTAFIARRPGESTLLAGGRTQKIFFSVCALMYPLLGLIEGRTGFQLDWPLISHAHVLIVSLAFFPLVTSLWRWILIPIPLMWSLFRGAFAWELGLLEFYGIVAAALFLIGSEVLRQRQK